MSTIIFSDQSEPDFQEWTRLIEGLQESQSAASSLLSETIPDVRSEDAVQALKQLSRLDREILTRFYLHEESVEHIGGAMSLSPTQVRLYNARAKMRFQELHTEVRTSRSAQTRTMTGQALSIAHELQKLQAPVFMRALEVFGVQERALAWMEKPNATLGGLPPIEALLNEDRRQEVLSILGRIEHGVIS